MVYLEYMDGGYSLLGIFRRGKWYDMSTCTGLSVPSKIICIVDLFSLLSVWDVQEHARTYVDVVWKYMKTAIYWLCVHCLNFFMFPG